MRKLTRRTPYRAFLSATLLTLLFATSDIAIADAHSSPPAPAYIECQQTDLTEDVTNWWSNTGNSSNFDQKLTVGLWTVRDIHNAAYCGEMVATATLQYRKVSAVGRITACIIDYTTQTSLCDSISQPANLTNSFVTKEALTGEKAVPVKGYASGEWYIPNVIDILIRAPASGYYQP